MSKKITVTLAGQIFTIINQDDLNYVEEIAGQVDRKIKYVQRENEHFSITAAAVLSCMDFCDELNKMQKEIIDRNRELFDEKEKNSVLTEQIKGLMSEIQALKLKLGETETKEEENVSTTEGAYVENLIDSADKKENEQQTVNEENKRPAKKEYVPRNNRKRNRKKAEDINEQS